MTANRSPFLNLSARHSAGATLALSGNAYYRDIRTNTLNGDINDDSLDQSVYQPSAAERAALTAAGYTGFPTSGANAANTPFPFWRCIAQASAARRAGPRSATACSTAPTPSSTTTARPDSSPGSTRCSAATTSSRRAPRATAAASSFQQSTQLGYLNPDRSVTGVNAFGDGVTGGTVDGVPFDTRVDLHGQIHTGSVYATDTLSLGNAWHFTLSGRYNRTTIDNGDRITPGGGPGLARRQLRVRPLQSGGRRHVQSVARAGTLYFGYSEGSRAPTSIELGCADPTQPCKLPNAMAGDPPLEQVVTRTWEAGVRGRLERGVNWSAGWFRADNRQRHPVRGVEADRLRLFQELRQDAAAGARGGR